MLAELEEVIEYKLVPERRSIIKEMWWQRLKGEGSEECLETQNARPLQ
jgi:hypothetical protein